MYTRIDVLKKEGDVVGHVISAPNGRVCVIVGITQGGVFVLTLSPMAQVKSFEILDHEEVRLEDRQTYETMYLKHWREIARVLPGIKRKKRRF